jgi:hypothetical protein
MSTKNNNRIVQPYLFFEGRCEEAVEFYRKALGAEVTAADRHFAALAECGQVQVPLQQGPFFAALRHGRRPVRSIVDDHGHDSRTAMNLD